MVVNKRGDNGNNECHGDNEAAADKTVPSDQELVSRRPPPMKRARLFLPLQAKMCLYGASGCWLNHKGPFFTCFFHQWVNESKKMPIYQSIDNLLKP
jgi:hypothetical protein